MGALLAALVWYVPGWMRCHTPQDGVIPALTNVFASATVEFKEWDGDVPYWPKAGENADATVARLVDEIAAMPAERRAELTVVGHSLGGRITTRLMSRLAERGLRIRQAILMAAAIPYRDPDVAHAGGGSTLPVLVLCNPDDVTLRYVYALAGGEPAPALGANGAPGHPDNFREYVVPASITRETKIDRAWAELQVAKDVANHHALFYIACLRRIALGEELDDRVMVPQDFVTVEWPVIDAGVWWDVVDECKGWKLERNRVTGHARILDPQKVRRAWGTLDNLKPAFAKVRDQL